MTDLREKAYELKQKGYSFADIARELGISKSTAYKYVQSANLKNYVEGEENSLEVVPVKRVIEELNKKITRVETEEKIDEGNDEDLEEERPKRKIPFILIIVAISAVVAVAVAAFFIFRSKETKEETVEKEIEERKEKVTKERKNPDYESTYDYLEKYGLKNAVVI